MLTDLGEEKDEAVKKVEQMLQIGLKAETISLAPFEMKAFKLSKWYHEHSIQLNILFKPIIGL